VTRRKSKILGDHKSLIIVFSTFYLVIVFHFVDPFLFINRLGLATLVIIIVADLIERVKKIPQRRPRANDI